jgi:multicomponent Na+:H+ antiporter subunit E
MALVWGVLVGTFTPGSLMVGFVIGYFILALSQPVTGTSSYFRKIRHGFSFFFYFLWQIILSNIKVAYDVITPQHRGKPGVVAIPLDARSDFEITSLANVITLTPGSLTLDVSADRKVLYVHAMYVDDPEEVRREIKEGLERRLLEFLR